jgi:small-conductance mechanosensitive channel
MNVSQINTAIIQGSFTNEELISIIDAVKFARSKLTQQTKYSLRIGDRVEFTSTKQHRTIQGTVTKIAIKYVTVSTNQGAWRVPANMLRKVELELA